MSTGTDKVVESNDYIYKEGLIDPNELFVYIEVFMFKVYK